MLIETTVMDAHTQDAKSKQAGVAQTLLCLQHVHLYVATQEVNSIL